jgi:hypothetical protein
MHWMELVSSLVHSLAWPAAAVLLVLVLRAPISRMLSEVVLRRLKAGPVEIKWDRKLEEVKTGLEEEKSGLSRDGLPSVEEPGERLDFIRDIATIAEVSPWAAVMESYLRLEMELRRLLPPSSKPGETSTLSGLIRASVKAGRLTPRDEKILHELITLRNIAVHGGFEIEKERALEYAELVSETLPTIRRRLAASRP